MVTVVLIIAGTLVGALCTACVYETQSAPLRRYCPYCLAAPRQFCSADGKRLFGCVHIERTRP
jgi:hypothetical protein